MTVAVLERDPSHGGWLRASLESAGHHLAMFTHWTALVAAVEQTAFDAIVLDCAGANGSDTEVLQYVRARVGPVVPILTCSKRCGEMDIVEALRAGADDYLVKPLRRAELVARLEAVMRRRARGATRPDCSQIGEFRLDCRQRTIHRGGVAIPLTSIDFDLAALFLSNVHRLLTREHIHEVVWKRAHAPGSRTLDTHVSRVRNKLRLLPAHGWGLVSVYGYGYRLLRLEPAVTGVARMPVAPLSTTPAVA